MWIFLCPLCIKLLQAIRNRSEKWFFELISIFVSVGQYLDQIWNKFENPFFRSIFEIFFDNRLLKRFEKADTDNACRAWTYLKLRTQGLNFWTTDTCVYRGMFSMIHGNTLWYIIYIKCSGSVLDWKRCYVLFWSELYSWSKIMKFCSRTCVHLWSKVLGWSLFISVVV